MTVELVASGGLLILAAFVIGVAIGAVLMAVLASSSR